MFLVALDLLCSVGLFSSCSEWGLPASWSVGELLIAVVFCLRARALGTWTSVVVVPGLSNCSSQALDTGSVVVVHRLSCPMACGVFLNQESNPPLLHWQADSLPLREPRVLFMGKFFIPLSILFDCSQSLCLKWLSGS